MKNSNRTLTNKTNQLSSLEYAGLEYVFQKIIDAYETDYLGFEPWDTTPVSQSTKRTRDGLVVFDGVFDFYPIRHFAAKQLFLIGERCVLAGFHMDDKPQECGDRPADIFIDVTEFLDESTADVDCLLDKLERASREF